MIGQIGKKKSNPVMDMHREKRKIDAKKAKQRSKEAKHNFLKSIDADDIIKELQDLDDMEHNPHYGATTTENTDGSWVNPGMHREKLSATAIDMKRERLHARLDEMMQMYKDIKDDARYAACKRQLTQYQGSLNRKKNYGEAIKLASSIDLADIIMPMGGPDPKKKQRVAETVNGKPIPKGANKEAIEAATRARNRIRGCPPPPNLPIDRLKRVF